MTFSEKIELLRATLEAQQIAEYKRTAMQSSNRDAYFALVDSYKATVKPGRKYTNIDFNGSGMYMVVNDTGEIFSIKGYGVIHRGHYYGTLDTIADWDWSGYRACRRQKVAA